MNISQHLCLPLGQYVYHKYINSSRVSTTINNRDVYGCHPVQDFPMFQYMNKYVNFNNFYNAGSVAVLRLWNTPESDQASNISSGNAGYGVVKNLNPVYQQYAVINSNEKQDNYQVRWLFWKEPVSPLNMLSLGNTLTPDVINDEEEVI